ncbi:MAG: tRNA epoxyqueuosine(34) reductase QueG [Polyangiaceae bacterium]|jgi:epoxyqueuosine reductase
MAGEFVSFLDQPTEARGPLTRAELTGLVRQATRSLGFDAVGIARADLPLTAEMDRYAAFLAGGLYGEMKFLEQNRAARARLDGPEILLGAKSVICVARRYRRTPEEEGRDPELARAIARYARGRDYHRFLRRRLRRLATLLRKLGTPSCPVRARPLCDEEPVLERAWAARAGLGFVGKNGLLIVPGVGSMVLLGEVVTTLELEPDVPLAERCGSCTRCLEACPTGAFMKPFVLDPRRCIAYLTIEKRTEMPIDLAPAVGEHLFGCDDCQTVCPFNAGRGVRAAAAENHDPFAPLERWSRLALEDLLILDEARWREIAQGTPLRRAGRIGLARNAAIVLGNRGDVASLPALRSAASAHDAIVVREAAAWASSQLDP